MNCGRQEELVCIPHASYFSGITEEFRVAGGGGLLHCWWWFITVLLTGICFWSIFPSKTFLVSYCGVEIESHSVSVPFRNRTHSVLIFICVCVGEHCPLFPVPVIVVIKPESEVKALSNMDKNKCSLLQIKVFFPVESVLQRSLAFQEYGTLFRDTIRVNKNLNCLILEKYWTKQGKWITT